MLNRYRPEGSDREWKAVQMVIHLDAELNFLLENQCWNDDSTKKDMVLKFIREALEARGK